MSHSVFIGIDYDDAYEAVVISGPGDYERRFETGDPIADFAAAVAHGQSHASAHQTAFMTLSSLDGFVFDVPGWRFNAEDLLEREPRDYHPDGRVKTRLECDTAAEDDLEI